MILDTNWVRQPPSQWQFLLLPIMLITIITWLVIPAASSQTRLLGAVTQSAADGSISGRAATPAFGQTQSPPVINRETIFIDSVKLGPLVWQVRGLGVLAPDGDGRFRAEIVIAKPQARNIEIGQPASVDTRVEGLIPGKVVGIKPGVTDELVIVEVSLEGDLPKNIKSGLHVDGTIDIERLEDVLYVGWPVDVHAESTATIFKIEDDGLSAIRVRVTFGKKSVNSIEIVDGLKVGDKVILSSMEAFKDMAMVRVY